MPSTPSLPVLHATDICILGGGLAALTSALTAREHARNIAVVSLGPIGRSGNTLISGAGISSATDDAGNDPETYLRDLLHSGKGVSDPTLTSQLAGSSEATLLYLEKHGVPLKRDGQKFFRRRPPGHSVPRNVPTNWSGLPYAQRGLTFMSSLARELADAGVPLYNGLKATHLAKNDKGGMAGVVVYDRRAGTYGLITCKRVILATGGYGGLFRRTNNVADMHGDGVALALRAGATVRDLEMVQFFPSMMYDPVKMTISNSLFGAGAVVRNRAGERFMERYDPAGDMATRDSMARAIFLEVAAGRGIDGYAYIDCTGIPVDVLRGQFGSFCEKLSKYGLDPARDWLKCTPSAHYTLGGVRIDAFGRTDVPGLYAAGEVAGGVHGVNRLAGAALMEAAVFGRQAGFAAATDTLDSTGGAVENLPDYALAPEAREPNPALGTLRDLLWDHVSLVREARGLQKALDGLAILKEQERARPGGAFSSLSRSLLVAEAAARCALMREESRGAHYRSDFPHTDPAWSKSIYCALQDGVLQFSA